MRIGLAGAGRIGARHAATLAALDSVDTLLIADPGPGRAADLAGRLGDGVRALESVDDLFTAGLDGLVVAAATAAHADLVIRGVAAGMTVFCEKPVAPDVDGTLEVLAAVRATGGQVQVGFQRRFDAGHRAARAAVADGSLGWLHTVRSCTLDPAPPPDDYLPGSGGIFRDCVIHDLDGVRYVAGRDVLEVVAVGANRGSEIFAELGDVASASAVLTFEDGTLGVVSASRYNAAGYDVRLEALGSAGSVVAGLDERTPLTRAGSGVAPSAPYGGFLERFAGAYTAEMTAFADLVARKAENQCPPEDALEALYLAEACDLSRREGRTVTMKEIRR